MPNASTFEDLAVWQRAHDLALRIYRLTGRFPSRELYSLTNQMRRCAVSIPSNIAEGFARAGRSDKVRFYNIAQGSLQELRYQLILANDLRYADTADLKPLVEEIGRMLNAYIKAIRRDTPESPSNF